MQIQEFKDINQIEPHQLEDVKRGILLKHADSSFKKSVLEMSLTLTKYVA